MNQTTKTTRIISKTFGEAFDNMWNSFDKFWENLNHEFDEESPESAIVKTTIRISLTKEQIEGLLTGKHKQLLFKVRDDIAIQVGVRP